MSRSQPRSAAAKTDGLEEVVVEAGRTGRVAGQLDALGIRSADRESRAQAERDVRLEEHADLEAGLDQDRSAAVVALVVVEHAEAAADAEVGHRRRVHVIE